MYTDQFNVLFNIFLLFYMVFMSKWTKINQERYAFIFHNIAVFNLDNYINIVVWRIKNSI
jgi:hypothetical protein